MIPRTEPNCQALTTLPADSSENWQQALANIIRDPQQLFELLQLDQSQLPAALTASQQFSLRVPHSFVERMEVGNPNDPLLLQVLPQGQELDYQPGFSTDPLEEAAANPRPGLIHKYHGRVLLVVSGACAINCRYCFRRHFPYGENNPGRKAWKNTLAYISDDTSISEVILSGGDPLTANDTVLTELIQHIEAIPHVRRLRIHSRLPIVIPQRIDEHCLAWMSKTRLQTVMVVHSNHANEISPAVGARLRAMQQAGITVLNQTVLLKNINDNSDALCELSESLFHYGVLPYYLHLLDKVQGAAHFITDEKKAGQLLGEMIKRLPGYLVPKLVRELPNEPSKTPIAVIL
jgi:EF-P beta-lysylation protein EpmB